MTVVNEITLFPVTICMAAEGAYGQMSEKIKSHIAKHNFSWLHGHTVWHDFLSATINQTYQPKRL